MHIRKQSFAATMSGGQSVRYFLCLGLLVLGFHPRVSVARLQVWSVETPPHSRLEQEHGFVPTGPWFENMSRGALLLDKCPAALVSASGLVATSLRCARSFLIGLSDSVFYAPTRDQELQLDGIEAFQLVGSYDESSYRGEGSDSSLIIEHVQIGRRNRVQVFRRYSVVRLVFIPQPEVAFFSAPETFPNAAFDVAFFRLYGDDGILAMAEGAYQWSHSDLPEGSTVFVGARLGNVSDGVVEGFPYNGTIAPPYTTLYGIFELHYSDQYHAFWTLPEPWIAAKDSLNLAIQLQFVSTARCDERNAGAPVLNRQLELVGIAIGERGSEGAKGSHRRCVAVAAAGILEVLGVVYGASSLVQELAGGLR